MAKVHMIKLSVGTEDVDDLRAWQKERQKKEGLIYHRTRMRPRREKELLDGGSIYWVIKGVVRCRQRLLELREKDYGEDGIHTWLVLDEEVVETQPWPHRAFQGWRYLPLDKAPPDARKRGGKNDLPPGLEAELRLLGIVS